MVGQDLTAGYPIDLTIQALWLGGRGLDCVRQEVPLWEVAQGFGDELVPLQV